MKLPRDFCNKVNYLLDNCIPPIIRDARWFMRLPAKLLFGNESGMFFEFKDKAPLMSESQYVRFYKKILPSLIKRDTCINKKCFKKILNSIKGKTVLDVGCGNASLASRLSNNYEVTGVDIIIDKSLRKRYPNIYFIKGNVESLPFKNHEFDTVICTHTLEHVQNIVSAISELRRIANKRLIIIVPKQRPYRFTFDTHLHFFPYEHSLLTIMGNKYKNRCEELSGDLLYIEDYPSRKKS